MASSFGVQLKRADGNDGPKSNKSDGSRTPGGARRSDFKTKPVSDLKAMFDKKEGETPDGKVATTSATSVVKTQVQKTDAASANKFGLTAKTTTTKTSTTGLSSQKVGDEISDKDRQAFAALKNKIDKTGINNLIKEQPKVAVAKTYSGGTTYQATVGAKKVQNADSSSGPVTKGDAASMLSFGLTKLRTRPNSSKLDDDKLDDSSKRPSSPKSFSPRPGSPKYLPGAAKGWKGSTVPSDTGTSSSKSGKFSGSSLTKVKDEVQSEQKLTLKGFRSVSPVSVNSDDSSGSSNLSPRGFKPLGLSKTDDSDKKTDVNENIKKFEKTTADTSVFNKDKKDSQTKYVNSALDPKRRTDLKSKESTVGQFNLIKEKNKTNKISRSASSDSEKGKRSPRVKDEIKLSDKSKSSLEEFKQQVEKIDKKHKPLSRASSSGSNSSLSLSDSKSIKTHLERFGSPDSGGKSESKLGTEFRRKDFAVSRKISTDKFQDIKKGFENKGVNERTQSPSAERKPKLDIKPNSRILERKQSFEGGEIFRTKSTEKKEITLPKKSGYVLKHIQALHELDAKAKAQPTLVRRTRSLPSTSDNVGDDSSDCFYEDIEGPYYHDAISTKAIDDISNEGDISSEADLYEVIPAHKGMEKPDVKKDHGQRRATAFRKRRKASDEPVKSGEPQPGTDGDIDSDTDSSNSGVYEKLDRDEFDIDAVSESDDVRDSPPEPPSLKSINSKKKNKKPGDKAKGFKGKIKQLYNKSKNTEGEPSRLMSSLGDKLKKNLKKTKSSSGSNLVALSLDDNPVCDSEGTDTDFDQDLNAKMSNTEDGSEGQGPVPPPLPPRQSGLLRANSGGDIKLNNSLELPARNSATNLEVLNNQTSGADTKSDPPLPPRNRISNNLDLNIVIPVKPGGDGRKAKDSYLIGQKVNNTTKSPDDIPYIDMQGTPSPESGSTAPHRPSPTYKKFQNLSVSSTDSYVDVGDTIAPPVPQRPSSRFSSQSSYVDVGDAPGPDTDYSLADEIRRGLPGRKELEKRPESSAYIKSTDLSTVPKPRNMHPPESDVLTFCNQYEEDGLYIDLSDDQVYGTAGRRYKSQLESESLYQFYNKEKVCRASKRKAIYSSFDESDEEGYYDDGGDKDSVYEDLSSYSSGRGSMDMDKKQEEEKSNKMSTLELFGKKGTVLRALWAEMPEVKKSGVLDTISPHERKLQESMFEIITSEATYLKSLNVLIDVFLMSEEFGSDRSTKCVITKQERHVIFSNIGAIRDTSERFLSALESRWKENVVLSDVCDIIASQASNYFECYVHYCSNQAFQDRAVTDLKKKQDFLEALRRLESHPDCQGLPMISFLLLPMQRITRLPLLVDAICHRMDPIKDKQRHKSASNAFSAMSKVVKKCNDGAKKMQQTEQMYHIAKQIDFTSKEIASIPLISASRYLVKQGEVTRIANDAASRLPFGKTKAGKQTCHLFLFNDLLLITKKKGDRFSVTDYGKRNALHVETIDNPEKNARVLPLGVPSGCKNLFLLVMLENHEKNQVETVFACNSTSDRARWVDAVTPVKVTEDDQRIYEEWDCPQVQCVKQYVAQEPDELSLEESDVVNVFKKIEDGMWEGERLRDGERGWFPKDHTIEIVNSHVRARNLRMKYRLMTAAGQ